MEPFAVGDDAVEVEDEGVQWPRHRPGTSTSACRRRSPARIGVFSRFSEGGNGQSYSAL
jgi:hypothetical protein